MKDSIIPLLICMRKNMEYHQLTFTLDKQVRGKYEMPHTVCIESKNFTEYILERNRNISMYFENKKDLYERMPDHLHGKLLKRKNAIDFMDFDPSCLSLVAVISDRIKKIFNQLNVSTEEYVLKNISIKGFTENFHLLFIPIIRDTDFIYPKCVFVDMFNDKITKVFSNRTEYYNDPKSYYLKKVTLKSMYKGFDLLYPQGGGFFFSERVVDAMRSESTVGYDIVQGGCFYETIDFE